MPTCLIPEYPRGQRRMLVPHTASPAPETSIVPPAIPDRPRFPSALWLSLRCGVRGRTAHCSKEMAVVRFAAPTLSLSILGSYQPVTHVSPSRQSSRARAVSDCLGLMEAVSRHAQDQLSAPHSQRATGRNIQRFRSIAHHLLSKPHESEPSTSHFHALKTIAGQQSPLRTVVIGGKRHANPVDSSVVM
jgi:hypothetical protein